MNTKKASIHRRPFLYTFVTESRLLTDEKHGHLAERGLNALRQTIESVIALLRELLECPLQARVNINDPATNLANIHCLLLLLLHEIYLSPRREVR